MYVWALTRAWLELPALSQSCPAVGPARGSIRACWGSGCLLLTPSNVFLLQANVVCVVYDVTKEATIEKVTGPLLVPRAALHWQQPQRGGSSQSLGAFGG